MARLFGITAIVLLVLAPARASDAYLAIYHIDVGQGDSTLIVGPSGTTLLVDGGNVGMGRKRIAELLRTLNIRKLDYIIATHYDGDHIGGLDEVVKFLENVPAAVFDRGKKGVSPPKLKTKTGRDTQYAQYLEAAAANRNTVQPGQKLDKFSAGVSVLVVAANGCVLGLGPVEQPQRADENSSSVALVLNFGRFDYFIGGDLTGGGLTGGRKTRDMEGEVAAIVGDVDVLRINHHGSGTSSNEKFLQALNPETAVISVGAGGVTEVYHHPRRQVLDRLHDLRRTHGLSRVFMTNKGAPEKRRRIDKDLLKVAEGNVTLFTNGEHYTINGMTFGADEFTSGAVNSQTVNAEACETDDNT